MITVTDITPVSKGKYRTSFDNGITCVLYRGELVRLSLEPGSQISEEIYDEFMRTVVGKRATKRAMHLLEQMDRSEKKLREKLTMAEYPPECVNQAIEYVKSFNYLDDRRFATNYVRYHQDGMSRMQLKTKLIQKGIGHADIEFALESEYEADESKQIKALLIKKNYNADSADKKEASRMYQFLLRRGFKSNDILRCMRSFEEF